MRAVQSLQHHCAQCSSVMHMHAQLLRQLDGQHLGQACMRMSKCPNLQDTRSPFLKSDCADTCPLITTETKCRIRPYPVNELKVRWHIIQLRSYGVTAVQARQSQLAAFCSMSLAAIGMCSCAERLGDSTVLASRHGLCCSWLPRHGGNWS